MIVLIFCWISLFLSSKEYGIDGLENIDKYSGLLSFKILSISTATAFKEDIGKESTPH